MAFDTTRIYYDSNRVTNAPAENTSNTSPSTIGDIDVEEREVIAVAVAGNVNADPAVAFDAVIAAANVAIQALLTAWGLPATNTIDYNAKVIRIVRGDSATDIYLPEADTNFLLTVDIEIAVS